MNTKRFLVLMAALLVAAVAFAACNDEPEITTDSTTTAELTEEPTGDPNDGTTTAEPDDGTTTAEPDTYDPDHDCTTTAEPETGNDPQPPVGGDDDPDGGNTTTEPPATTTEPPATTTEPPATTTEPPATTTEPPATTTGPNEDQSDPPAPTLHEVKFVDWNGTVIDTQNVADGTAAVSPVFVPNRAGYDFVGWDVAYNNVTAATVVTAQYVEVKATEKTFAISSDNQTPGTVLSQTALKDLFAIQYDASGSTPAIESNKMINLVGFSEMVAKPQGAYTLDMAYTNANVNGEFKGFSAIIARGVRATCEGNRYYGSDGDDDSQQSFGGAGIYYNAYFKVWDTAGGHANTIWTIRLNVKTYENGAFVSNVYEIDIPFAEAVPYLAFRVVDDGTTVSLIAADKTLFTVTPEGTKDYGFADVGAYELASKATVKVYDRNTGAALQTAVLENACVGASVMTSDLAMATRQGGILQFRSLSLAPKAINN